MELWWDARKVLNIEPFANIPITSNIQTIEWYLWVASSKQRAINVKQYFIESKYQSNTFSMQTTIFSISKRERKSKRK